MSEQNTSPSGDGYYSEYIEKRKPSDFGNKLIRRWHGKLLAHAATNSGLVPGQKFLEIGPGHGQFATCVQQKQFSYHFVDMSESVSRSMTNLGFHGYSGKLNELPDSFGMFDVVWISHVLEHCATWVEAREMLIEATGRLKTGGILSIVSPDILSSKAEFWASDFSHGYPTSIRNVSQLMSDVGLDVIQSTYHRNGRFGLFGRALPALITMVPHRLIDYLVTPKRRTRGEGFFYSWKSIFGWRQILVIGQKKTS
jgi:hypothetical protein